MNDVAETVRRLLEELMAHEGAPVPSTALGRMRRTAGAALRAGVSAALAKSLQRGDGAEEAARRLVLSLGELKGVAMKVGQILSYMDAGLPDEVRTQLALLQKHSQPTTFAKIEAILREDFGERAGVLLGAIDPKPVATASVGQVHRGRLPDGTEVAIKVRHPGIDVAIRADFKAASLGKVLARLFAPGVDIAELIEEAQTRFLEECDYVLERERQERFGELYRGRDDVCIPHVHPDWCSERVLTTTWQHGLSLETFAAGSDQAAKNRAGEALYDFYLGSLYRHGLFNADPHPGNVLFAPNGSVTVLDHGCVRAFEPAVVRALAALSLAVRRDDVRGIRAALKALGVRRPEANGFEATRTLLRAFYAPVLEQGVHPMRAEVTLHARQMMEDKRALLRLQLPGKLLFLFRIRFGLYAVLARVGAALDWQRLEDGYTRELAGLRRIDGGAP